MRPGAGVVIALAAVAAPSVTTALAAPAATVSVAPASAEAGRAVDRPSPLQARVEAAAPGDVVNVGPGTYRGDLVIDRPIRLSGRGRPRLVGSGEESVVRIRAAGAVLEGFDIDGLGGGDLGRDTSGVHVSAPRVIVRDCRVAGTLFGIYLHEAPGSVVENCRVRGIAEKEPGEKGSGIHVWNTVGFTLRNNDIADVRDGLYIQSASEGRIVSNVARDLRYGLHYMYSNDIVFEDNTFENGAAGTAIMYSRGITFRRNRFLRNRGFASVGLLLRTCDDVVAEGNLIADNARGIFLEGSNRITLRGNVVAASDMAIMLYASCSQVRVTGNSFIANLTPLLLVGRRTDTVFDGNYWSDNGEPDLDGDGMSDRPYRLTSVFDHLRGNLIAADLMAQGSAALALAAAEESFPVLRPIEAVDARPLARPPDLPDVPRLRRRDRPGRWSGLLASVALGAAGLATLWGGTRRSAA